MSDTKRMSDVERMIYAHTFARKYLSAIKDPPPREVVIPSARDAWEAWETDRAVRAIEAAAGAVEAFRDAAARVDEGYGDTSVADLYREAREGST